MTFLDLGKGWTNMFLFLLKLFFYRMITAWETHRCRRLAEWREREREREKREEWLRRIEKERCQDRKRMGQCLSNLSPSPLESVFVWCSVFIWALYLIGCAWGAYYTTMPSMHIYLAFIFPSKTPQYKGGYRLEILYTVIPKCSYSLNCNFKLYNKETEAT